jgi:5-methylcytosine-specific restriction enzyme A
MARTAKIKEWIGDSDDQRAPKSVRDRLKAKFPKCNICTRKIEATEKMALDHVKALINGGENRESNLRPVHQSCHKIKTAADVAEKAKVATIRQKHNGIVDPPAKPLKGRGFNPPAPKSRELSKALPPRVVDVYGRPVAKGTSP